jgi:hypothetical protein
METMYFVVYTVHNKNTDAWAHNSSGSNSDVNAAQRLWGSEINRLFGSDDFDFVSVAVENNFGDNVTKVVKDVRVDATTHLVSFNSHGGSEVEAQTVNDAETATEPTAPINDGYTFAGWELDGYEYNFDNPVYEDIILVAQWS